MASYDPYDGPTRSSSKRYYREERRDDRDTRYGDGRDSYLNVHSSRDLVPRPREDSDLSVEEVHRDFPPPGYASRDAYRSRSAEPGYYDDDYDDRRGHRDRDHDRDHDRRPRRKAESVYYEEEERKKVRMLSKQEQIIAAVTGAALAIGGKELFDRRDAKTHGTDVHRNLAASAALGAAGAFAGYQGTEFYNKKKEKDEKKSTYMVHKGRDGTTSEYYSDDEDAKDKKGHKNFLEGALAAAGLGGAVKALTGGGRDDKSDTRSRGGSRSGSHERGKGPSNKIQKAAMASLIAGATEAFRVSKQPGGWKGEKAKRILTAAAGAATLDAAQDSDKAGTKLGLAESVIGGLVGNRVINGSKKNIEEDKRTGRSRSRSRAGGSEGGGGGGVSGLAALATAGLGAFGAKKLMDNREKSRERSRDRSRRRGDSRDSYDDDRRGDSPDNKRRSRSRSVVDTARRSLAKFGIGNGPDEGDDRSRDRSRHRRDRSRGGDDDYDAPRGSRRQRDRDDHDDDRSYRGGRDDNDDDRSRGGRDRSRSRARGADKRRSGSASSSDLGDSDQDEKRAKKMKGKLLLTTGLAGVATIHAAHNVYQSMEKRNARRRAVKEGRLSPEEAKKLKTKALLQDAASVGIAALGIKGAISELKEAKEMRHEIKEWQEEKAERHQKRLERAQHRSHPDDDSDDDDGSYGRGRQRADSSSPPPRYQSQGPRYRDGNPYAALPPPPLGYSDRGSDRR